MILSEMTELNVSQDMFEEPCSTKMPSTNNDEDWLGINVMEFKQFSTEEYVPVKPSNNHTVLFKLPIKDDKLEAYPSCKIEKWDSNHVRMPNSSQSLYPTSDTQLEPRWPLVKSTLKKTINSSKELESAIFTYNSRNCHKWTFDALHHFFANTLDVGETKYFFKNVLPGIIELALDIESKFNNGIPFLKKGMNHSISMSQEQAAILLANAFLCTFPRRNTITQNQQYPSINFNRLFQCGSLSSVQEKLKCFINYFRRVSQKRPRGVITFTRRCIKANHLPIWAESGSELSALYITSNGTIEKEGAGMLEIDFANKFVGGGVLGRGSVQEEIKFLICPELVVSRLFTECLDDNEALIVTGCERYNNYIGYGETFTWAGNYLETEAIYDCFRRLNSVVVAIDATLFNASPSDQYKLSAINRELNKAYAGFSFGCHGNIATGNWGCGAFKGDPKLKFLLQMMAASVCKKKVAYFTFGDILLKNELYNIYDFMKSSKVTVGMLWQTLSGYHCAHLASNSTTSLYDYIYSTLKSDNDSAMESWSDSQTGNANITINCVNDSEDVDRCEGNEPVKAAVNSLKSDEGRKRCMETDRQRWQVYQEVMAKHGNTATRNLHNSNSKKTAPVKRKISDYFSKQNNN